MKKYLNGVDSHINLVKVNTLMGKGIREIKGVGISSNKL